MAQIKQQSSNLPITPRKVPPAADATRSRIALTRSTGRTQSFRVNQETPQPRSPPLRTTRQKPGVHNPPPPPPQSRLSRVAQNKSATVPVQKLDTPTAHKPNNPTTQRLDNPSVHKLDTSVAPHKSDASAIHKVNNVAAQNVNSLVPHKLDARVVHNSGSPKYDPLTGLTVDAATTTTNESYEKSYIISSSINPLLYRERPIALPPPEHTNQLQLQLQLQTQQQPSQQQHRQEQQNQQHNQQHNQQQNHLQKLTIHELEESVVIPTFTNDDGLPVVSIDKNHIPVFARFPFDVTFLPRAMETNVEDNIHKLRLRLIEAELNHQRRSTDDYIKRTQEQVPFSNSKPIERYVQNVSSTNNLMHQLVKPKVVSRQTSYSQLSIQTPIPIGKFSGSSRGDRIGMTNDVQDTQDIERDLQIRRIEDSLSNGRQSNPHLTISNYSYDPRLHLQPLNSLIGDRQYTSSNMDDLIDSMARRHLAYRRLDAAIDRQRRGPGGYSPYSGGSPVMGRQISIMSQQRDDDIYMTNMATGSHGEPDFIRTNSTSLNQMLRPQANYYNHILPDNNDSNMNSLIRVNSYSKLPPISPGMDSNRLSRAQNPSNSILYQAMNNPQENRYHQKPLNLPKHTEHLIELPSDIFLSSRTEVIGSSQRQSHNHHQHPHSHSHSHSHHQTGAIIPEIFSKDKSDGSADSEIDQSDAEHILPNVNHHEQQETSRKSSENDHDGFFTEGNPLQIQSAEHHQQLDKEQHESRKALFRVQLFKKVATGIVFINALKRRAARNQLNRPTQTLSATIHKIRLQEIMVALHRVYLEPDGPIYNVLIQAISSPIELKDALNPSSKHYLGAINLIGQTLKNVISKIVDFMPRDGILGTAKTSAVAALIQDGNPFPDNYFWQCEKEALEFNKSKVINITKQRAILLLLGIFIFRALVTTLLVKPIKYRFLLGELPKNQSASLKVLASVIMHVSRRAAKPISQILALPHEWESVLYSDTDIEPITQHAEIKSIITTCELSLRVWCEEYVRRIDASFGKELRT